MQDYVDVFNASYGRAVGNSGYNRDFIGRFYEIFLSKSDQIAARFEGADMSAQKTMLHDSLQYMVDFFSSRRTNAYLERIAEIHSRSQHDIPSEMYDTWLESLIEALREFDPELDEQVELAWRLVLSPGITYMKFMHDKH